MVHFGRGPTVSKRQHMQRLSPDSESGTMGPMSTPTPVEAVRGMRDILPLEQHRLAQTRMHIESLLASYGYLALDLPIVEHRDLYLRKMGEDLVGKIYEFPFGGRNLSLRPEWTASVLRAYVAHMQEQPLPLRLSYSGPVFRYQRPQRLTFRQFTQVGGEIIGAAAPRADAEVLAMACAGLDAVGVPNYQVRLGHIGVVREVLIQLGLSGRTQGILMWNLERIRSQGSEKMCHHLYETIGMPAIDPALLEGLDDEQATTLLLGMLQVMGVNLSFGTRSPEAIVGRLVRKLRCEDTQPRIDRALDLLERLSQICDLPAVALDRAAALFDEVGLSIGALNETRAILSLLESHTVPSERLLLDFGMGRGLHYYTGMIFEIYNEASMQLCGGGRYDDLVQLLGGRQPVPAAGFAYGLERVVAAIPSPEVGKDTHGPRREVLVVPMSDAEYPYAQEVAQQLRSLGFVATVDVRGRSVSNNVRDATRRNIAHMVLVGAEEQERHEVIWRNLDTRQEQRIPFDEMPYA